MRGLRLPGAAWWWCDPRGIKRKADLDGLVSKIRNWPDAGIVVRLDAVIGLANDWGDRERKQLREAGIASPFIECDGAVWAAASMGHAMDGTPMVLAHAVMGLMWTLDDWRENLPERLAQAERAVNQALGHDVVGGWEPKVHENEVGLVRGGRFHQIAALP